MLVAIANNRLIYFMTNHPKSTQELYRRLLNYVLPFWPALLLGTLANIVFAAVDAGFTYMIKPIMNNTVVNLNTAFMMWLPFIIFGGVAFRGFVNAIGGYCMTKVARSVIKVLRQKVFNHILHLPVNAYDNSTSGQLLSKMLYDVEQVAQVSADALTTFVQSACLVSGLLVVMLVISWPLTLLFLAIVPLVIGIVLHTNKKTRKASHAIQLAMEDVTEIASEAIEGYQVVRIFGGQSMERQRFNNATEEALKQDLKVAKIKVLNVAGVQVVIGMGISAIVTAGIYLSSRMPVSAGEFIAIIAAVLQLIKPMKNLSTVNSVIQRGIAGAESVFNLLDSELERQNGAAEFTLAKADIEFRKIDFHYEPTSPIFRQFSLSIRAGETVALVGRSGSGKSTLMHLLAGFYPLVKGDILIEGISINALSLDRLRQHIAFVSQHVTLFNDTIAANIAYGQSSIDIERVREVAGRSYALAFIEALPEGFDTRVGENGLLLSGGQRQRIAIARALYKNAPILILDEATSALDNESEGYIQKALIEAQKGRTTLIIAHRLSTIRKADKIVVLEQGKIVESGTHQSLLARGQHYARLYQSGLEKAGVIA